MCACVTDRQRVSELNLVPIMAHGTPALSQVTGLPADSHMTLPVSQNKSEINMMSEYERFLFGW